MPSAFICIEKYFYKKIKKMLSISKAIRVFESPLLCIWKFEYPVHIFRGPWFRPCFLKPLIFMQKNQPTHTQIAKYIVGGTQKPS